VVHRDIKPENVLLQDGRALVADFGIALAVNTVAGSRMTETGMSLGTPHYMSPEQAMGERVLDGRTDIYALGCVLYEMLTGEPPFTGPTAHAIVGTVMTERAAPPSSRRDTVPPWLDQVVRTALEKLAADRYPTAARLIDALEKGPAASSTAWPRVERGRILTTVITAGVAAVAGGVAVRLISRPPVSPPTFAALLPPPGRQFAVGNFFGALSPDGRRFAFVSTSSTGDRQLWLQDLGESHADSMPRTAGAAAPFWAPDGRSVAYVARGKLWRLDLDGSPPRALCEAPLAIGGAWGRHGDLVVTFAREIRLGRADSGECATRPGDSLPQGVSWTPTFFPGGCRFLLTSNASTTGLVGTVARSGLRAAFPGVGMARLIVPNVMVYSPSQTNHLLAQRIDLDRLVLLGQPLTIDTRLRNGFAFMTFTASTRAVLYLRPPLGGPRRSRCPGFRLTAT